MEAIENNQVLFICHECDALQKLTKIEPGSTAFCACCGSRLFKNPKDGIEKPLALFISSFILFLVANLYPIMTLDIAGIKRDTTLTESALIFIEQGAPELALVVWLSSVFIPGFIITGLLYILISVRYQFNWPYTRSLLAWVSRAMPWGMMDVFLLGILVALVKLVALADIVLGAGFFAFVVLIFIYAAAISSLEPYILWKCLGNETVDKEVKAETGPESGE